jgi:DNA-binding response OmpR family regulator
MKRVLIVDDEPHVIRIMRLALENAGYHVDEASNGLQALEYLQQQHPDAMITDIDMPRMNGRDLCLEIGETMPDRMFRIYVLTARAEDEHRVWSATLDNLEFMEKPVSVRRLVTVMNDYLSGTVAGGDQACRTTR